MSRKCSLLSCTVLAVLFTFVVAKHLDSEQESFPQNQFELQQEGVGEPTVALENALVRYLMTKEWLSRLRSPESDGRQMKRGYWKQCAFNAVSCFGK